MNTTVPTLPRIHVGAPTRELAAAVSAVVNEVYDATEGPLWTPGVQRTDVEEVLALLGRGEFLVALADEDDPTSLVGAVKVTVQSTGQAKSRAATAEFGMLAVAPHAAGRGLGEALVRAAEAHAHRAGTTLMEIVVIRPAHGTLPAKELLGRWYPRLGYTLTATAAVTRDVLPTCDLLVVDSVVDTYARPLTPGDPA